MLGLQPCGSSRKESSCSCSVGLQCTWSKSSCLGYKTVCPVSLQMNPFNQILSFIQIPGESVSQLSFFTMFLVPHLLCISRKKQPCVCLSHLHLPSSSTKLSDEALGDTRPEVLSLFSGLDIYKEGRSHDYSGGPRKKNTVLWRRSMSDYKTPFENDDCFQLFFLVC